MTEAERTQLADAIASRVWPVLALLCSVAATVYMASLGFAYMAAIGGVIVGFNVSALIMRMLYFSKSR